MIILAITLIGSNILRKQSECEGVPITKSVLLNQLRFAVCPTSKDIKPAAIVDRMLNKALLPLFL